MGFLFAALLMLGTCISYGAAIPMLFDAAQGLADLARYKEIKGHFRVEAEIIKMLNPRGTTWNFVQCDLVPLRCDPRISGVIDYDTPNNDFGKDSVQYKYYVPLFEGKGLTNVDINKFLTKDVCGHGTRKVNVRIRALDVDMIENDIIDQFDCFILTTDPPAENEKAAQWSAEKVCEGHNGSHKIMWKYRWYFIPEQDCKETPGSSSFLRQIIPVFGK